VVGLEAGPFFSLEGFASESESQDELAYFRLGRLRWNEPEAVVYNGGPEMVLPLISRNIGVGGPLHWSCISYRFHESDFRVKSGSGKPEGTSVEDWPIGYSDLEPYYDRAEYEFGVAGKTGANPFEPPRARPFPMTALDAQPAAVLFRNTAARLGYQPYPAPAAIATSSGYRGNVLRESCNNCGRCTFYPCARHAKGVNLIVTLPEGLATGLLEIRPECVATQITVDKWGRAASVLYCDREGLVHEQPAHIVIACNNAAYVTRLLLLSKSERFPQGLANSSGLVGKNLTFHASAYGYGTFEDRVLSVGLGPQAAMAFDDLNEDRPRESHGGSFIRGAVISGGVALPFTGGPLAFATTVGTFAPLPPGVSRWGESFKNFIYRYYNRYFAVFALCEDLPVETNRIELDPKIRDRWGMPVPRIVYTDHPNTTAMQHFMRRKIEELLQAAGARDVVAALPGIPGGAAAGHVMGTTRMGSDPDRSVVDEFCRSHDVPNLFIGGSGVFVTAAGLNPTLTIFALAYRTAEQISRLWRQGAFAMDA
jgi:choline dehydrogenase-like flavoprotein